MLDAELPAISRYAQEKVQTSPASTSAQGQYYRGLLVLDDPATPLSVATWRERSQQALPYFDACLRAEHDHLPARYMRFLCLSPTPAPSLLTDEARPAPTPGTSELTAAQKQAALDVLRIEQRSRVQGRGYTYFKPWTLEQLRDHTAKTVQHLAHWMEVQDAARELLAACHTDHGLAQAAAFLETSTLDFPSIAQFYRTEEAYAAWRHQLEERDIQAELAKIRHHYIDEPNDVERWNTASERQIAEYIQAGPGAEVADPALFRDSVLIRIRYAVLAGYVSTECALLLAYFLNVIHSAPPGPPQLLRTFITEGIKETIAITLDQYHLAPLKVPLAVATEYAVQALMPDRPPARDYSAFKTGFFQWLAKQHQSLDTQQLDALFPASELFAPVAS